MCMSPRYHSNHINSPVAMSLDKKLTEVFTIFQDKDKNVVSVKDIPTIIRCLGKPYSQKKNNKIIVKDN